jgi:hypothetical protein
MPITDRRHHLYDRDLRLMVRGRIPATCRIAAGKTKGWVMFRLLMRVGLGILAITLALGSPTHSLGRQAASEAESTGPEVVPTPTLTVAVPTPLPAMAVSESETSGPEVVPTTSFAATSPGVPAAAECTVEPRPEDELRALFREVAATPIPDIPEASPTPAVPPPGEPADEQTVAEISATWRQFIACIHAGDQARMFALFSDDMVRRQLYVDIAFGVTEEALFDFLAATPVPLAPDVGALFVPIDDARVLEDGRVAVIGPGEQGRAEVRIFVKEGDRWVIDDWFELTESGTPADGTPPT